MHSDKGIRVGASRARERRWRARQTHKLTGMGSDPTVSGGCIARASPCVYQWIAIGRVDRDQIPGRFYTATPGPRLPTHLDPAKTALIALR